jgi:hypothetical protein
MVVRVHRSRFSTLLIDVPVADAARSTAFWSAALAAPARPAEEPEFTELDGAVPGLVVAVQAIDGLPRHHVDIETDDVDAVVARLVGLGATEESSWQGCRTLRAPGGHLLCVIPCHSDPAEFERSARTWP